VDTQTEEDLRQGVGWLGSATNRRQCLACESWTGQVARRSGLRKEGHNTGTEGNEGRNGREWVHCGRCLCTGDWDMDRIRIDVVEVRVLCWEVRVVGVMSCQRKGSDVAVATSVAPTAFLPKFVECCRILDSSLAQKLWL
jgi:hypothetical protein